MAIKHLVDDALKTPMSRRQFLGQVGAVFLAVIGVTSILHALSNKGLGGGATHRALEGYGSSAYGGKSVR